MKITICKPVTQFRKKVITEDVPFDPTFSISHPYLFGLFNSSSVQTLYLESVSAM